MGSQIKFECICRLCGLESSDLINLFESRYNQRNLPGIIRKYIRVSIIHRDALPQQVCGPCVAKLDEVVEFMDTSQATQNKLKSQLKESSSENNDQMQEAQLYELIQDVKVEPEEFDTHTNDDLNDEDYDPSSSKSRRSRFKNAKGGVTAAKGNARKRPAKLKNKALLCVTDIRSEKDNKDNKKENPSTGSMKQEGWMGKNENLDTSVEEKLEQEVDGLPAKERKGYTLKSVVRCCICKADFFHLDHLTSHCLDIHQLSEPRYMCPHCPQIFPKITSMNNHQRRKHQDFLQGCPKCKKLYPAHYLWTRHMLVHTNTRPFSCDECDKKFKSKDELYKHKKNHRPTEERYTHCCEVCGKRFTQKGNLESHLRIHTGTRPYSCEFCGKCFSQKGNMEDHRRIHTGEKPFVCDRCGVSYSRKSQLSMHRRRHAGEKPHKCLYCEKEFLRRGALIKHEYMHTDTRPYQCSFCEKRFRDPGKRKVHERLHTGERPYECQFCGRGFCESGNLRKHLRVHQRRPAAAESTISSSVREKSANVQSLGTGSTVISSDGPSYNATPVPHSASGFPGMSVARLSVDMNTESSLVVASGVSSVAASNSHPVSHSIPSSAPTSVSAPISGSPISNGNPLVNLRPMEETRTSPSLPHQESCEKEEYRVGSSSFQTVTWALYHT